MSRGAQCARAVLFAVAGALAIVACGSGSGGAQASGSSSPAGSHTSSTVHSTSAARTTARSTGSRDPSDPLSGMRLWVNPTTSAALQASAWRRVGRDRDASLVSQIAQQPTAKWLTGGAQPPEPTAAALVGAAQQAHAVTQLVLYDIPDRDCHGFSSGGAPNAPAYLAWVGQVVRGLAGRPVIIILEPDAIDQAASGCMSSDEAQERYGMLANATKLLRQDRQAHIFLDAGDAGWLSAQQMFKPLYLAGIADDDGFSLNVANFYTTAQSVAYGQQLSQLLQGKHFVIDTSRNGNGSPPGAPGVNKWCNPSGRALGQAPTTTTGNPLVDAYLWVKYPGQSDGDCQPGQPPAGVWWPSYALGLVENAHH